MIIFFIFIFIFILFYFILFFLDDVKDIKVIDKIYDDIDNLSHHWLSFMLSLLDGVKLR